MKTKENILNLKRKFIGHFNLLVLTIINSADPSEKEVKLLEDTINGLLGVINQQKKGLKRTSGGFNLREYNEVLDSQESILNLSLKLLNRINKKNKSELRELSSKLNIIYEEERSFYI